MHISFYFQQKLRFLSHNYNELRNRLFTPLILFIAFQQHCLAFFKELERDFALLQVRTPAKELLSRTTIFMDTKKQKLKRKQ